MAPNQIISSSYPYLTIRFTIRGLQGTAQALIDTGFSGDLAIPTDSLNGNLGLPDAAADWELANGSKVNAPIYLGKVEVTGFPSTEGTITLIGNEYILGRGIINHFRITFDHGKRVIVEP